MASNNNNKMAKGGSSKTVTPLRIHSASPTPNTRQHDATSSRAATGGSSKTVTPLKIHSASTTSNTRQHDAASSRAATDEYESCYSTSIGRSCLGAVARRLLH
uniref:Uncharacterized protein n=1 Tax=Aegilops tauschii subsp. strangulata TaxID=200361 RepID=A0A453T8X9_AEGTS